MRAILLQVFFVLQEDTIRGECTSESEVGPGGLSRKFIYLRSCSDNSVDDSEGIPYNGNDGYFDDEDFIKSGPRLSCLNMVQNRTINMIRCSERSLLHGIAHKVEVRSSMHLTKEKAGKEPSEVDGPTEAEIATLTQPTLLTYDSSVNIIDEAWKDRILQ